MDINENEYFLIEKDKNFKDNRSFQGIVLKAIDVQYPIAIGEIIYNENINTEMYSVGKKLIIYLNNYEVMTVPKTFVDKLIKVEVL